MISPCTVAHILFKCFVHRVTDLMIWLYLWIRIVFVLDLLEYLEDWERCRIARIYLELTEKFDFVSFLILLQAVSSLKFLIGTSYVPTSTVQRNAPIRTREGLRGFRTGLWLYLNPKEHLWRDLEMAVSTLPWLIELERSCLRTV